MMEDVQKRRFKRPDCRSSWSQFHPCLMMKSSSSSVPTRARVFSLHKWRREMKESGTDRFSDILEGNRLGSFNCLNISENLTSPTIASTDFLVDVSASAVCFSGLASKPASLASLVKIAHVVALILFMSIFLAVLAYPMASAALSTVLGASTR